jgi:hypothetical protein
MAGHPAKMNSQNTAREGGGCVPLEIAAGGCDRRRFRDDNCGNITADLTSHCPAFGNIELVA